MSFVSVSIGLWLGLVLILYFLPIVLLYMLHYDQALYFLQHLYTLTQILIADKLMSQLGLARINMPRCTQHNCDYFQTENCS